MKKIGIIDYYIDEWHANTYIELFERANKEMNLDYRLSYVWAELDHFGDGLPTAEWCKKNHMEQCASIAELCEKSDNILILAPSDPQTHLGFAREALKCGKTTYIDKTFADSVESAKEIFALSEKYGAKIFSTSALRYAKDIEDLENIESLIITGGGRSLQEYVIHQIEMAVKLVGTDATELRLFNRDCQATVVIDFAGKPVTLNWSTGAMPFCVNAQIHGKDECEYRPINDDDFFYGLVKDIYNFFETDKFPFDSEETVTAIAIRDAILKASKLAPGTPVKITK